MYNFLFLANRTFTKDPAIFIYFYLNSQQQREKKAHSLWWLFWRFFVFDSREAVCVYVCMNNNNLIN